MSAVGTGSSKLRVERFCLRVSRSQKALIDRAAEAQGRNRSDFILETACREAESVLLDQCYFHLGAEQFRRFTAMLDVPPKSNPRLARLLKRNAPWDEPRPTSPAAPAPARSGGLQDR
jgi:uncharacterized protein (DUF1778 family)